jgi:hypothetical protein
MTLLTHGEPAVHSEPTFAKIKRYRSQGCSVNAKKKD